MATVGVADCARGKRVETRCWTTRHRGLIAIHASAGGPPFKDLGASRWRQDFIRMAEEQAGIQLRDSRRGGPRWFRDDAPLPTGCVLATADLYQIQEINPTWINELSDVERTFGNYETGRQAWFLQNIKACRTPIPAKGNRLLWEWAS